MSPNTQQQSYEATDLYVPVQRLQTIPQLANATTPPPAPATPLKQSAGAIYWASFVGVACLVGLVAWTAADTFYGGVDKRALQAELATAQQQAEALQLQNQQLAQQQQQQQDAIHNAAAALGCISNGGPVQ